MSSPIQGSLAKDRLGIPSVIFFVMSAAAPLTVVAGVVTTGYATTQVIGIPFGFITIAVILGVFSVGYVAMSRHITNAGAFYTYVANGLGRPLGVGAAWMALLAYNALQVGLYGIIGAATQPLLKQWFNLDVKWWAVALVAWALVAILGVLRVDINGKVLALLLCAEILIILIYDFADLGKPASGGLTFDTLLPGNLFVGSAAGAVLVLTFLGFTGFESAVVFSEESKNPRRTIAMATYLSVAIIGIIYALSSWAMSVATGPGNVVQASADNGPGTIFGLAAERLPTALVDIGSTLFATSVLAAMISFHNTVARYTFALGRERVFPSLLSTTGRRSGAPVAGSLVQSLLGLAVIVIYAAFQLDPVVQLFFWIGTAGGFGILVLVALTSIAVFAFFMRDHHGENSFRRIIAPLLATVLLGVVVYFAVSGFSNLLGVAPDDPLRWIIPACYPAVAILGILWALILKATKPDVYQSIGLGANSVSGVTTQSRVLQSDYAPQHGNAPQPESNALIDSVEGNALIDSVEGNPNIVSAQAPDAEWIADLIGGSFQHLGVTEWLLPDPAERAKILPRNFQIFVEYALTYGVVHVFEDRSAAAVWVPNGFDELPPPHDYDRRLAEVCGPATERFQQLDALFDANHPHEPHHHLAFLGVSPTHQGNGRGSRLLDHHHATLDREHIAGFLEASSTGSRDLYSRKGYDLLGEPYAVPNGALFWPMWRQPRST